MPQQKPTVKARAHHGTSSLNLTIPAEIVRNYKIVPGDVFEVTFSNKGREVMITYRLVYSQPRT